MQEKFRSFRNFLSRTDDLAANLGVKMREIPAKMGISERMLYGYRSGKYPVTAKAWAALERAERSAGIMLEPPAAQVPPAGNEVRSSDPKELPAAAGEKSAGGEPGILERQLAEKDRQIERLLGLVSEQAATIRALAERGGTDQTD
jgi:hypothetical protein